MKWPESLNPSALQIITVKETMKRRDENSDFISHGRTDVKGKSNNVHISFSQVHRGRPVVCLIQSAYELDEAMFWTE